VPVRASEPDTPLGSLDSLPLLNTSELWTAVRARAITQKEEIGAFAAHRSSEFGSMRIAAFAEPAECQLLATGETARKTQPV
jgi:hypothetical protein